MLTGACLSITSSVQLDILINTRFSISEYGLQWLLGQMWSISLLLLRNPVLTTLAARWGKNYIQAVSVHAPHPHPTNTTIPVKVSAARGTHQLRSTGSVVYVLPRTRTRLWESSFFYCGPASWNTLLSDLYDITDTSAFRKRLFDHAYHWLLLALLDVS